MSIEQPSKPESRCVDESFVQSTDLFLDELSTMSQHATAPDEFYNFLLSRLQVLTGASDTCVLVPSAEGRWVSAFSTSGARELDWLNSVLQETWSNDKARRLQADGKLAIVSKVFSTKEKEIGLCVVFSIVPDETWSQIYCDLVRAVTEIVDGFEQRQIVRKQDDRFARLESFVNLIKNSQTSLDLEKTGYHLANDCRHFLSADRTWIFTTDGRIRLLACSNVAEVNERSRSFVALRAAINEIRNTSVGSVAIHSQSECPCEFQRVSKYVSSEAVDGFYLERLVDRSTDRIIGYFVAEYLRPHDTLTTLASIKNLLSIIECSVGNAQTYSRLPFRKLTSALGSILDQFKLNALPRSVSVLLVITAIFASMFLIKTDFEIAVSGQLRPSVEQNVFAPADSVVEQVEVGYGDRVTAGQVLLQLSSNEYSVKLSELQNSLMAVKKELEANQLLQSVARSEGRDQLFISQVTAKLEQNRLEMESIQENIDWYIEQQKDLTITAPINGVVMSRDLRLNLMNRPIKVGSQLVRVADTDSPWEIQFDIPDREFGYLLDAKRNQRIEKWSVAYKLESNLEQNFVAEVVGHDRHNSFDEDGQNYVRAYVPFNKKDFEDARVGQSVLGRVNCGRRSLFFVWTRDIRDFIRSNFFWM